MRNSTITVSQLSEVTVKNISPAVKNKHYTVIVKPQALPYVQPRNLRDTESKLSGLRHSNEVVK